MAEAGAFLPAAVDAEEGEASVVAVEEAAGADSDELHTSKLTNIRQCLLDIDEMRDTYTCRDIVKYLKQVSTLKLTF